MSQESNQTLKEMAQTVNQTGEAIQGNASDFGANISKSAKDLGTIYCFPLTEYRKSFISWR